MPPPKTAERLHKQGGRNMLKQILIDADTGIDDSIAILFALKRPDVRVMGVTTGFGNTTARQAAENSPAADPTGRCAL